MTVHQQCGGLLTFLLLAGCAESVHQTSTGRLGQQIPDSVRHLVDESVSFTDVKASPGNFNGKTVMFGGEVLRTKRSQDRTEVEILQLPLSTDGIPTDDRGHSQGRFIAQEQAFLDPATLPPGTPLTVVGTVDGELSRPLGEGEDDYTYPVLRIVQLLNWPTLPQTNSVGGWPYAYNPYAYYGPGYWGPGFYAYPYWSPWGYRGYPFGFPRSHVAPSPGAPPSSVPPQFRGSVPSSGGSGGSGGSTSRSIPRQFQKRQ